VGLADGWGRRLWAEHDGTRRPLRYCRDNPTVFFAWGRQGIGARELARALLFDATGNAALAERYCRDLTHDIVARLPEPAFALDRAEILAWLTEHA
jgi:hypothetical protein